jgi:hypothetical protein
MAQDEYPFSVAISDDDKEKIAISQQVLPEDYYQYRSELILPQAQKIFKTITKDFQLGNLGKEEYDQAKFIYGLVILCLRFPKTRKAGVHFLRELNNLFVSSNSKDGFLRKNEATTTKVSEIKQSKMKRMADRSKW